MICVEIEVPYASFRKSYARSFAETYPLVPPATVYGLLLSLIGERFRARHQGVRLAFAYKRMPMVTTTLRKLSRYKYGVPHKQSTLGNAPDYVETLCGLDFVCWIDSSTEMRKEPPLLEERIRMALREPGSVERYGILSLGLSDDAVDQIKEIERMDSHCYRLIPDKTGELELPIWVDHVGSAKTRWNRYTIDQSPTEVVRGPQGEWTMTTICGV